MGCKRKCVVVSMQTKLNVFEKLHKGELLKSVVLALRVGERIVKDWKKKLFTDRSVLYTTQQSNSSWVEVQFKKPTLEVPHGSFKKEGEKCISGPLLKENSIILNEIISSATSSSSRSDSFTASGDG